MKDHEAPTPDDDPRERPTAPEGESAAEDSLPANGKRRPRRRWFQFSLLSLLLLMVLVGLLMREVGIEWYRTQQRKWAADALREAGAVLTEIEGRVEQVQLVGPTFDDAKLAELAESMVYLNDLRDLYLVKAPITDDGLRHLAALRQLRNVYVSETDVTDEGIAALAAALPDANVTRDMPTLPASRMAMRKIYRHAIVSIAWRDDRTLVSGSGDGVLRVWDRTAPTVRDVRAAHREWLFAAAFSPDGRLLATAGGDNQIKLWDADTWGPLRGLGSHDEDVHALAFTPDGRTLVSAGDDCLVRVWDVGSGAQVRVLSGHEDTVPTVAVSSDGRTVASGSRDGTIRLWDLFGQTPDRVLRGHAADVLSLAFSPDGALLASASYDGSALLWDGKSGEVRSPPLVHDGWVCSVAFDRTGTRIATGASSGVRVWDVGQGELTWHETAQSDVAAVAFSPDGTTLASAAADGNICLRSVDTGVLRRVFWGRPGERGLLRLPLPIPTPVGPADELPGDGGTMRPPYQPEASARMEYGLPR